jgi:two-component system, oxyanion-binding sensor
MTLRSPHPSRGDFDIHVGFIPLVDAAPLIVIRELGFDKDEDLRLHLHREVSWANIRDRIDAGVFDCAHMLGPLPFAATLGIGRAPFSVIAPVALSLNGSGITMSNSVFRAMTEADAVDASAGGMKAATAFAEVVGRRKRSGAELLTLGMVFPFSNHNYDLRLWLTSAGIDPDNDINLIVVPPPLIAESLKSGRIDGFCAGAPWGSVAMSEGTGVTVATKHELWNYSPEKVLGVSKLWADRHPDELSRLIRCVVRAARWLDDDENRKIVAEVLARPEYLGVPAFDIARSLSGRMRGQSNSESSLDEIVFHRHAANFPWQSHGIWILRQMQRWHQAPAHIDVHSIAAKVFRTDIYRNAVASLGPDDQPPEGDLKREGPEGYFAGQVFDPFV